jgi:DNA-binding NarL/FixJ family response regulator
LRWIREQPLENLCVVVLTSANSAKEADDAMELGADAHLSKQRISDSSAAEIRQIVQNAYYGREDDRFPVVAS